MTPDNTETVTLTREQLALLNNAATVDDPRIVAGRLADGLARLDTDDRRRLADARTPTVIDVSGGVDPESYHDALEALQSVTDGVVVERAEAEAIDVAREALAAALVATGRVSRATADRMSMDALCAEYEDLDDPRSTSPAVTALNQMPETGGGVVDDLEDTDPLEALSRSERAEIADRMDFAGRIESRLPKRAATIRDELAADFGVTLADLEAEVAR